jgi:hypothetical protein
MATNYEFAVAVARSLRSLGVLKRSSSGQLFSPAIPESPLLGKPEVVAALSRLVLRFGPELTRLGVRVDQLEISNAPLIAPKMAPRPALPVAPPFADVPQNHWAYDAVETLRKSGMIIGYTNGETSYFNSPTAH